jgi:ketosteroid isomerase-like protein
MHESPQLRQTALRFYDRFSANDVDSFDSLVAEDARLFIGTADDEWFTDRAALRSGFGFDGLSLDAHDPRGWEEGTMGWVCDRPVLRSPATGAIRTRFTGVFRRDGDAWKLVVSHFSVGVPDAEVAALQGRWLGDR